MVKGTFQLHGTRCGKHNCKCLKGEPHPTAVLAIGEGGGNEETSTSGRQNERNFNVALTGTAVSGKPERKLPRPNSADCGA